MQLIPVIASYSGETHKKIKSALTDECLDVVARVATSLVSMDDVGEEILAELRDMHIVIPENSSLRLTTAVFLEDDIREVVSLASALGRELAQILINSGAELADAAPETRNFLGGIVGAGQGPAKLLREANAVVDWSNHGGRYAQSKVDFDEVCDARESLGADLQNKSVLRGEKYTAIFIGPGGRTYPSLVSQVDLTDEMKVYRRDLLRYLTDAYAMLVGGLMKNDALARMAEQVGLFCHGEPRSALVEEETFQLYLPVVRRISDLSYRFYFSRLEQIYECLRSTASGRQGVEPENMMMHFWRYCRRALARELYGSGFFTDSVPATGSITVFYDNDIDELRELLG